MGEDSSQIEQRIVDERAHLGRNLEELESRAREIADWRTHFRNHPGAAIGLAFGAGMALGMLAIPASDAGIDEADATDQPDRPRRVRPLAALASGVTGDRAKQQIGETWQRIADALLGVAAGRVVAFVSELVPGFRDHYDGAPSTGWHPGDAGSTRRTGA
jgi:hypothetical protein